MTTAFVLMTAMPPTKGHLNLIRFAASVGADETKVVVCTQEHEPFGLQRYAAVKKAAEHIKGVEVKWLNKTLKQDPSVEGFWEMWDQIMYSYGAKPGDWYVTSEPYGQILAGRLGGNFLPYDPARELYYTKATNIRENMVDYFDDILPEFQKHLVTRVTVFGAESNGKTTLSKVLAERIKGHWIYEWARPYLELTGAPINAETMARIWKGQNATQRHVSMFTDKAFIVQDTDLYSTIGYWEQPHWAERLGPVPPGLVKDAEATKSDLYIILTSDIPFEPDPLRYGVDKRESDDAYWLEIAKKYNLNYVTVSGSDLDNRVNEAVDLALAESNKKAKSIYFDRAGL